MQMHSHLRKHYVKAGAMSERQTQQRAALRQVFEDVERPLAANDVLALARDTVPSLNLATVYRNLNRLVEEGWLRQIYFQPLGTLYERTGKPHHHHFYCLDCKKLLELDGCAVDVRRAVPPGFVIHSHELFFEGLCDACS
jgi:Fur family ferric uptake transcriptional regulator